MDRVRIDLEHCYGIKSLKYEFDFTGNRKAYAIYAPNGAMKSSLALTFKDLSNAAAGAIPRDRIFPDRKTVARVTDEKGNAIENDRVLVVESYDDKVCPTEKHGALLVEPKLRDQYERLQATVNEAKDDLLNRIRAQSKSKANLEAEISKVFAKVPDDFQRALNRVKDEVREQDEAPFANVEWDKVFAENIVTALNTKDLKNIDGTAELERENLLEYLSNGEKKAFYILQVIFEIQRRIAAKQETLIIVDDLADSFDYQNKYAIVEYLRDISQQGVFKQLILTHNFDFLRTIEGRLVSYAACLIGLKSDAGIELAKVDGLKNIFVNKWKPGFFNDNKMKIGSIAFLRNLVENARGTNDPAYEKLTWMVHWRPETAALTVDDLDEVFRNETGIAGNSPRDQFSNSFRVTSTPMRLLSCFRATMTTHLESSNRQFIGAGLPNDARL